jgi:hypothetical protein
MLTKGYKLIQDVGGCKKKNPIYPEIGLHNDRANIEQKVEKKGRKRVKA